MTRTALLQTNTFCLFVFMVSIYNQIIKVRKQTVQDILRINEFSIKESDWLTACQGRPTPN